MSSDEPAETKQIHARKVPAELHRQAKLRAVRDGVSMNALVVAALQNYLGESNKQARLLEVLEEIAGSTHGPTCPGANADRLHFKCSCHVRVAKAAIAECERESP